MAYGRFCVLKGDVRGTANIVGYDGSGIFTLSNNIPAFTGVYSFRNSAHSSGMFFAAPTPAARVSCMFSPNGMQATGQAWIAFFTVGNTVVRLEYDVSSFSFRLRCGFESGTATARTPGTTTVSPLFRYSGNQWYNVSLVACLHAANGFVSAYVDGVKVATWSGDTRIYESGSATPLDQISGFFLAGNGGSDWAGSLYLDDIYCDIGDGSEADACPPTRRFEVDLPVADGATVQWTPSAGANYAAVDDAPPDNDATAVYAEAADLTDLYAYTVTGLAGYDIKSVTVALYGKRTDAAVASTFRAVATDADATQESAEILPAAAYNYYQAYFPLAGDGQPWDSAAAVTAARFGVKSDGAYT
jgi:hypothetical protein